MSRMLNRLRNAGKKDDSDHKSDAQAETKQKDVSPPKETSGEEAPAARPEEQIIVEEEGGLDERLNLDPEKTGPDPAPDSPPAEPAAESAPQEGVQFAEVDALLSSQDDEAEEKPRRGSLIGQVCKAGLVLIITALLAGAVFLGLSKAEVIDAVYYDEFVSLRGPVQGLYRDVLYFIQGKQPFELEINDFDSPSSLAMVRGFKCELGMFQGLKPDLDDYVLDISFTQFGTRSYAANIDFNLNRLAITDMENPDISFDLKRPEDTEHPLRAAVILYGETRKFSKELGTVSSTWKRYTIPLSSFAGIEEVDLLTKMRLRITQPRKINQSYHVFVDDIALRGIRERE